MNTTFVTWMIVAALAGGLLLLLLASPVPDAEALEVLPPDTAYWEPVTSPATPTAVRTTPSVPHVPAAPACTVCPPPSPQVAPGTPTVRPPLPPAPAAPACTLCPPPSSHIVAVTPPVAQPPAASQAYACPHPVIACAPGLCAGLPGSPAAKTQCLPVCPVQKPGINRNFDPCVPECGMLQLHSTLPQPVCPSVRLEWTASKGSFLNPHAPNPIYLAPSTRLPGGEDVWIVLKMTDGTGVQYTDHITVRVMKRW